LAAESALIDGEAVVVRPDGHCDFAALRTKADSARACFVAFDLLNLNGEDFRLAGDDPELGGGIFCGMGDSKVYRSVIGYARPAACAENAAL
jgi:hypothetical protein